MSLTIRKHGRRLIAAAFLTQAVSGAPAMAAHPLLAQRTDHVARAVAVATPVQRLSPTQPLTLAIALPVRDPVGLTAFVDSVYDPASPNFHKFLKRGEFADRFGPTQADYQAAIAFAQSHGLTVTHTFSNRTVVDVTGPVSAVESAFHVNEVVYRRPDGTQFYAPDRQPTVDDGVPVAFLAVGGLDDADPPHHQFAYRPALFLGATGIGGFSPGDFKKAYDFPAGLTGKGVTLGVFQNTGYLPSDITTFEDYYGLRRVPLQNVYLDGRNDANQGQSGETTLDIEMQVAMAPDADRELVYIGGRGLDIATQIASDDEANVISASLGYNDGTQAAENIQYQQMAAQGQSYFVASGDSGSWTATGLGDDNPADQPYITSVGGTHLNTDSSGNWLSEPCWTGSCGGVSPTWPIPSYQKPVSMAANGGSTTMRNAPDVAFDADPVPGISFYNNGGWGAYTGGTSFAAPLWAGLMALVDQERITDGLGPIGFINPAVYAIGQGTRYSADFHDIVTGDTGIYKAVTGFDLTTGWGSPIVTNLVTDLAGAPALVLTSATTGQVTLYWPAVGGATAYNIYRGTAAGGENAAPYAAAVTGTTFIDTGVADGTTYYYTATAVTGDKEGPKSAEVSALPLDIPGNVTAAVASTGAQVTWAAVKSAASYRIYRGATATSLTVLADSVPGVSYTDSTAPNGATYYYTVTALGPLANEESGRPDPVSVTVHPPLTPAGLTATPLSGSIALSWNASTNATLYNVKRATGAAGPFTVIARPASVKFTDTDALNGVTYYYKVSAVDPVGESADTAVVSATPNAAYAAPPTPTGLMATAAAGHIALTWTAAARATSYAIKRATKVSGPYAALGTSATPSYTDSKVVTGTVYYYEVQASNAYGTSALSSAAGAVAK